MALGISMVAFQGDPQLSAAAIQAELAAKWPDLPAGSDASEEENTLSFQLGDVAVITGHMPAPIPWSDLEGPCATSLLWPNAAEELKQHDSHLVVTVSGENLDPLALSTMLTKVTAAVMASSPTALGVYWANATLVVPKDVFIDFAVEVMPHGPPLHVWVDFRAGTTGDGVSSGFTAGMKALGHMEIETESATEPAGELRERMIGLAAYLLENGPVINDGDTVGQDARERIRVVYADSAFGHEEKVMRLEYEATGGKPWWKFW